MTDLQTLSKPRRRKEALGATSRETLLQAAKEAFAARGLEGARVDDIARRARINKQLVYHYFGDKDALYLAVLEWVYEEIRAQERKLNLEGLPPEQAIKKLIESSFDHLAAHPDFIVLLNDENRGGARHVRGEVVEGTLDQLLDRLFGRQSLEIELTFLGADFLVDPFQHRQIQRVLVAEVMIDQLLVDAGAGRDLVDPGAGET